MPPQDPADTGGELDRKGLLQSQAVRLCGAEHCWSPSCGRRLYGAAWPSSRACGHTAGLRGHPRKCHCQSEKCCAADPWHYCTVRRESWQLACKGSIALACIALQGEVGQAAGLRPGQGGSAFCDLRQASELEQSMTPEHTERLLSFLPGVSQLASYCVTPSVHCSPLHCIPACSDQAWRAETPDALATCLWSSD